MPSARKTRVRRRGITERGAVLSLGVEVSVLSLCKLYLKIYFTLAQPLANTDPEGWSLPPLARQRKRCNRCGEAGG